MIIDGTTYQEGTPQKVISILERARKDGTRIRVHYGDQITGEDWLDEFGMTGRIGRSMGPVKIPLILASRRSYGGSGILTDCIVRIREAKGGRELYRHPKYNYGNITTKPCVPSAQNGNSKIEVKVGNKRTCYFKSISQFSRWLQRMGFEASKGDMLG